jgi:hypothetical protein
MFVHSFDVFIVKSSDELFFANNASVIIYSSSEISLIVSIKEVDDCDDLCFSDFDSEEFVNIFDFISFE